MSTIALTSRLQLNSFADTALKTATRFWFAVAVLGQFVFAFAVASYYGSAAVRGNTHAWKSITHGYVPGDTAGNFAVEMHLFSAVIVMLSGTLQLVPQIRSRFPAFHRWNGRAYLLTAFTVSLAGLYMTWIRGSVGDLSAHLGSTLNAVLIWLCAILALRFAMARDFKTHRRWALRLFIVVSASWFYRVMFFLILAIFKRPVGFDPSTFTGPLLTFMAFSQYLLPLAILEIYLRVQDRPGAFRRMATAAMLFVLTLGMAAGIFAVTMIIWIPDVKAAFDSRQSIIDPLAATIASRGVDEAVKQYHAMRAASSSSGSASVPLFSPSSLAAPSVSSPSPSAAAPAPPSGFASGSPFPDSTLAAVSGSASRSASDFTPASGSSSPSVSAPSTASASPTLSADSTHSGSGLPSSSEYARPSSPASASSTNHTTRPIYNFDESELNTLGYDLLRKHKFPEAIRIFELNVEAYPQSSNVYDSLAEACLAAGNKPQAIANYEKALHLNPKNRNAAEILQKLKTPEQAQPLLL